MQRAAQACAASMMTKATKRMNFNILTSEYFTLSNGGNEQGRLHLTRKHRIEIGNKMFQGWGLDALSEGSHRDSNFTATAVAGFVKA